MEKTLELLREALKIYSLIIEDEKSDWYKSLILQKLILKTQNEIDKLEKSMYYKN